MCRLLLSKQLQLVNNMKKEEDEEEDEEKLNQLTEIGIGQVEQLVYFMKHRLDQFGARFVLEAPGYDYFS